MLLITLKNISTTFAEIFSNQTTAFHLFSENYYCCSQKISVLSSATVLFDSSFYFIFTWPGMGEPQFK
jgi:hypothetical protein